MGQAAVDLPDPLAAAPVSSANTDDLLAQLAGEEIERLLAQSDEGPVDTGAPPAAAIAALPPTPPPAAPSAVSTLLEAPITADSAAPGSSPSPAVNADLDALFAELQSGLATGDEIAPAPSVAATEEPAPSSAAALAEEMAEDAATNAAGRVALGAASPIVSHDAQPSLPAAAPQRAASIPIYLRILDWISSPLDSRPDHVRDLVGKIAILTTVNAAAVLVYVIFIRGH